MISNSPFIDYRDILGKPGQGAHALRVGPFAIVDIIGTLMLAALISYFMGYSVINVLIILLVLAELLHILFGVETAFISMLKKLRQ